ncbi:protein abnormal spindle [Anopheles nili]|uniref:protein abnormal spindle n=1 Tax=Anopheles nili TaxID=185578 RepID=UPI00237AAE37|nr:protein abnormal spindle [Anopheles nili]
MSAFEVTCTPPRIVAKKPSESREPTLVLLGPFTPKATVVFEGVPVGKVARRLLIIRNTNKSLVQVNLVKVPDPECGVSFEWITADVEAGSEKSLEVVWSPQQLILGKEVVILTDNIGNKKDVQFIFKSIQLKSVDRKSVIKPFAVAKRLKLKSPSPPKVKLQRNILHKKGKASPAKKDWSTVLPTVAKSSKMGSITSRATTTILGDSNNTDSRLEKHNYQSDYYTSPNYIDSNRVNKENINPVSPSLENGPHKIRKYLTLPSNNDSYFTHVANQPTPESYIKSVGRKSTIDKNVRKHLEISPKSDINHKATVANAKLPSIMISTDPVYSEKLGTKCVQNRPTKEELVATPQDRTKFDPGCFSTVTKPTAVDQTYLKPCTGSPLAIECSLVRHEPQDDNLQRHLSFSPGCLQDEATVQQKAMLGSYNNLPDKHDLDVNVNVNINANLEEKLHTECDAERINNKTRTMVYDSSPHLSIIAEENAPVLGVTFERHDCRRNGSVLDVAELEASLHKQKTFNVASDESISSSSTEHIVKNATITIKQDISRCSLPNLLDKSSNNSEQEEDEVERIFKEHEIRAQSSRFNIHEVGRFSDEMITLSGCKRGFESIHDGTVEKPNMLENENLSPKRRCRLSSSTNTIFASAQIKTEEVINNQSFRKPIGFKPTITRNTTQTSSRSLSFKRPNVSSVLPIKGEEKRVFLYDSDRHLKTLINPDPFAATTTCNPFLSATMYLDERAFERYERQMKKWLNALVTIPADLDTEPNKPLDVGKLFDEVKSKELTLAPTKELISSNYYKNRLNSLRSAGIALYMSEEIALPLRKVAAQIEKQLLTLRTDRSLHLDLVLQRTVLELLLCFNPLWLRLGLEVVFGEQIELQSNRDIVGLSTFIIHRLFRDRYLEARNSKAYNLSKAYAEHMKKFTLRMVLFLLFFLDTAKRRKLIKHNPCLFVRNAPHKETREILTRFSSTLVAGIGDITKHLKRVGYTLSHKQSFLDEYNYAFENLAVDLRDGVRLTRVMEIILLRDDLSCSLRVPPISRLQKIHNINLALGALEQAEYRIAGDITAKDICDGHREQTMSLLWQIVYKFRAPKFNSAATIIQRWWRMNWLKVAIARRIAEKRRQRRENAARTIQAAVRGYCVRVWYEAIRQQRLRAVVTIQRFVRRYLAQKQAAKRYGAIVHIQQWWRSVREMRSTRERYLLCKKSVIVLQTSYRRYVLAKKLLAAATTIGVIRTEAMHRHRQAIIVQRSIKSYVIHRRLQGIVHGMLTFIRRKNLQNRSATKIQAYQRMRTARREFLRMRSAAVCVQRRWRECLDAKRSRVRYLQLRNSTICIQQHFRGWVEMRQDMQRYHHTRRLVIQLQRRWRATIAMRNDRTALETLRRVTINVQRRFRARKAMQLEVERYRLVCRAASVLQSRYRAKKAMVQQRDKFDGLRVATICIQRRFRAQRSMREARDSFEIVRKAIVMIQLRYRAKLLMRCERDRFLQLRQSTVMIQSWFRAIIVGRVERQRYQCIRNAAINLQHKWRATLEMRRVRDQYCRERHAAITIQRSRRSILLKRKMRYDYMRYRSSAIILQQRYRALLMGRSVRQEIALYRCAAIKIQRKLRAWLQMKQERHDFLRLRQTVLTVQRRFRANRACLKERTRYAALKRNAVMLSSRWYSTLAMRKERARFLRLKNAAITIQRRFRAQKAMQVQARQYEHVRTAIIFIQRKYRAQRSMERCRGRFLNLKSASILIQEFYRGYRQMKHERAIFVRLQETVISVQRRFRANRSMRQAVFDYKRKKTAAMVLQRWFRGHRTMVAERDRYHRLKSAALVVQARYRARRMMLHEKQQYDRIYRSVCTIQIRWKATIVMFRERAVYQRMICAAKRIQMFYRAYRERLVDESNYRIYRSAVIIVQRRYREKLRTRYERRQFIQICRTVRGLQAYGRGTLARRAFQAMLTPEYLEKKRREKAILRLQAWWRGVSHRKRFQTAAMRNISQKMVASRREAKRDPTNRVSNASRLCMRFLKTRFSSSEAIGILQRLERMSRLVPHLLVDEAVFLSVFCYNTMALAIRSEVDKILIEICARIILNLARFPGTKEQAFQENGLVTVSQMLLRWCDKNCGIFSTLCTLLWVLAHDFKKKNAIRRYMISKDAIFMLRETKKLVQRKEKMRKNVQRPVGCLVAPNPQLMCTVPSLEPDFGVNRSKPYVFYSSVFGFEQVLQILEVDLS